MLYPRLCMTIQYIAMAIHEHLHAYILCQPCNYVPLVNYNNNKKYKFKGTHNLWTLVPHILINSTNFEGLTRIKSWLVSFKLEQDNRRLIWDHGIKWYYISITVELNLTRGIKDRSFEDYVALALRCSEWRSIFRGKMFCVK